MSEIPLSDSAICIHQGDTGAAVWLDGDTVYKVHRSTSSYRRERDNYSLLRDARFSQIARLIEANDVRQTLVMKRVVLWDDMGLQPIPNRFRRMGECLAKLHSVAVQDTDTMSLGDALRIRVASALGTIAKSEFKLPGRVFELAEDTGVYGSFQQSSRRWCHRDFRPQNWGYDLASDSERIIDWEHARPDLAAVDFARLPAELGRKEYRQFCSGYAAVRALPSLTHRRFAVYLHILQTLRWSLAHGEEKYLPETEWLLERPEWWDFGVTK